MYTVFFFFITLVSFVESSFIGAQDRISANVTWHQELVGDEDETDEATQSELESAFLHLLEDLYFNQRQREYGFTGEEESVSISTLSLDCLEGKNKSCTHEGDEPMKIFLRSLTPVAFMRGVDQDDLSVIEISDSAEYFLQQKYPVFSLRKKTHDRLKKIKRKKEICSHRQRIFVTPLATNKKLYELTSQRVAPLREVLLIISQMSRCLGRKTLFTCEHIALSRQFLGKIDFVDFLLHQAKAWLALSRTFSVIFPNRYNARVLYRHLVYLKGRLGKPSEWPLALKDIMIDQEKMLDFMISLLRTFAHKNTKLMITDTMRALFEQYKSLFQAVARDRERAFRDFCDEQARQIVLNDEERKSFNELLTQRSLCLHPVFQVLFNQGTADFTLLDLRTFLHNLCTDLNDFLVNQKLYRAHDIELFVGHIKKELENASRSFTKLGDVVKQCRKVLIKAGLLPKETESALDTTFLQFLKKTFFYEQLDFQKDAV